MSTAWHYPRPALANQLTIRLKDGLFSRIAYMGCLGIGKTVFLVNDLSPALLDNDCIPVYISLWSNPTAPHLAFIDKLSSVVASLRKKGEVRNLLKTEATKVTIVNKLVGSVELDLPRLVASPDDISRIDHLLVELVELAKDRRVVLMLDEIQHLLSNKAFVPLHYGLRTILDVLGENVAVLYTGSSHSEMTTMFMDSDLPFYHSVLPQEFPLIDDGFVDFCVEKLKGYGIICTPTELKYFWIDVKKSPYWMNALMCHIMEYMIPVKTGIAHIKQAIGDSTEYEGTFKQST